MRRPRDGIVPLSIGRVSLERRGEVLASLLRDHRPASVAIPIYRGEDGQWRALVSRRARTNGATGAPMDDGGEVVLFGGAVDAGESALDAALRELTEETTPGPQDVFDKVDPLPAMTPLGWVGRWTVESGHLVDGFVVRLERPVDVRRLAWNRAEVEGIAAIRLADIVAQPYRLRARERHVTTIDGTVLQGEFESPHMTVPSDPEGETVELWGLAGYMLIRLVDRLRREGSDLLPSTQGSSPMAHAQRREQLWRRSHDVAEFLRTDLSVPLPVFLEAPRVSRLVGVRIVLQLESTLPPIGSGKIRSVASLACHAADAILNGRRSARPGAPDPLTDAFDGRTLVAASTGSHARAVCAFAEWLQRRGVRVATRLFVTSDISETKRLALCGDVVAAEAADFTAVTEIAIADCLRRVAAGETCTFVPTDPVDAVDPGGLFRWDDGLAGFATTIVDTLAWIIGEYRANRLAAPRVDRMFVPTSGGATWAACRAYLEAHRQIPEREATIGSVLAVGDEQANPVRASFAAGRLVEVEPLVRDRIPSLAQRAMSPAAFDLLRDIASDVEHEITSGSLSHVRLAQLLVFADTGLMPEPAGAVTIAAVLQERMRPDGINEEIEVLLRDAGTTPADLETVGLDDAAAAALGLHVGNMVGPVRRPPPSESRADAQVDIHVISGAWMPQTLRLLAQDLRRETGSGRRRALLTMAAAMLPLLEDALDPSDRASIRRAVDQLDAAPSRASVLAAAAIRHTFATW